MGKAPKGLGIMPRLIGLAKRNPWKVITSAVVLLGGLPAAYAGAVFLEPAVPAHRGYVRQAMEPVLNAVRDSQAEQAEGKRDAASDEKAKWLIERSKTKDQSTLDLIDRHIHELDVRVRKLDSQIDTLNRLKAKGQ